jgi:gluconokinase
MGKDIILGCDIGTGSFKVTACYSTGELVKEVHHYYPVNHPQPGFAEQNPGSIKNAFIDCLHRIMPLLPSAPVAMGFSSAMHSLMLVDKDNRALTDLIVWEDNRSHEIAEILRSDPLRKTIYENTGTPVHSMSPLCKIRWFRDNEPGLFQQAAKFIGIKEFLWHWMFGVYEVDISVGSATGLLNIHNLKWEKTALIFCGTDEDHLSAIVNTSHIRANPSKEFLQATNLPAGMKYCIGASDGCLANFGSGIKSASQAALTIGTSGAVRITSDKPVINHETMIFNYLLDENVFISGGPVNNGGNVLLWLFKTFLKKEKPDIDDFENLEKSLSSAPAGSAGLICIPWFYGERAPVWDEKASGVWMGVRSYHSEFHFFRAALEGVCFTLRRILESMEEISGPIDSLYISGGFTRSRQWVQMMADITHKKIVINEKADASSLGAILWTAKALGMAPGKPLRKEDTVVLPRESNYQILDKQYRIFCQLYSANADQMHSLSDLSQSFNY